MSISTNLKTWAKRIKRDGVTLWFAGKHPRTPWYAKALGLFVVAYALSPIDLIPDFIPVLGYLDDVILLPVLIWVTVKLLPSEVLTQCRASRQMNGCGWKEPSRVTDSAQRLSWCCGWRWGPHCGSGSGRICRLFMIAC